MFSNETIEKFVQEWFDLLNGHAPVDQLLPLVSNSDLEMVFPERTLRNHTDVREWYDVVGKTYTNQQHIIEELHSDEKANNTEVSLKVVWKAEQKSDGSPLAFRATQSWLLKKSPETDRPLIVKYYVQSLDRLMAPRETIDQYYKYANAGAWNDWCDLFAEDLVMDEQLAGHIEGLSTLRSMMSGGLGGYAEFHNIPKHIIVSGSEAAVVSQISATTKSGTSIESGVMNYFRFNNEGKIVYLANFHDSVPFKPVLEQPH